MTSSTLLLGILLAFSPSPPGVPLPADTLRGTIVDARGDAVAGARVSVAELAAGVETGADGRFAFALAPGRYTLIVERSGLAAVTRTVRVPSEPLEIRLGDGVFRLDPLEVTARRSPGSPATSALPVTMLDEENLRREHSVSLAKAVSSLAGVHAMTTGEQIGKPVVRGLAGSRVLVLENGHRLEDYSWSDEDGPSIDSRLAQRVEVIRGPASVLYGSDAIGGVINALPAPLPDATAQGSHSEGQIELYGATNNREFGTALRWQGAVGRLGWRGFVVGRLAEDMHTPAGKLENTGFGVGNGEIEVGYHAHAGTSTLRYSRYGGEFRLLEANGPIFGEPEEEEEEEGPERKLSDDRIQFDGNYYLGDARLETKAQWQRHFIAELSDDLSQGGVKIETEVFNLVLNTLSADVMLHHGGLLSGTLGVSGVRQGNDTRGVVPLVPDATTQSFAAFAFEEWNAGILSVQGGARIEHRTVDADANAELGLADTSNDYNIAVGSIGAVLHATDAFAFTANLGRAWRAPDLFEQFANGPRLGEGRYERGDADLTPETSFNLDAGLRWASPRLRAEASLYRNRVNDYIYVTPTDEFVGDLRVYEHRQADATLVGGELALEALPAEVLTVGARFDWVKGTNEAIDEPLPLIPARMGALEAELHTQRLGWFELPYLGLETEIVGDKTRVSPEEEELDGYALLNLEAGVQHHWGAHDLRLDVRLLNVTDREYRDFLSRYKEFAPAPGRNLIIRLSTDL